MRIVALMRPAPDPAVAAQRFAAATGVALAEARMRLAAEPPALLASLPDEAAQRLFDELRRAQLAVLMIGPGETTPKLPAHELSFGPESVKCTARGGESVELPWTEVAVILRGATASRSQTERTEKSRQLSIGTAVLSGGLKLSRTVEQSTRTSQLETEQRIWVFGRDGTGVELREQAIDFSCLGSDMQPVRMANMTLLARRLRQHAPHAFYDERLIRVGVRPLPFVLSEARASSGGVTTTRTSTAGGVELLVELMRRAVEQGLLP